MHDAYDELVGQNREALDEAAPILGRRLPTLLQRVARPDFSCLKKWRMEVLRDYELAGKAVCQLACNNGRELISFKKRLAVGRCVGVDLSPRFLEQARQLATAAEVDCEFVEADMCRLGGELDGQFDLVYTSAGVLCWVPDLAVFFATVRRLLRPEGRLYMNEIHPLTAMYSTDPSECVWGLWFSNSYFMDPPQVCRNGMDYFRQKAYAAKPFHTFHHRLDRIIQACIGSGLVPETMEERPEDISGGRFKRLRSRRCRLPLNFVLTARYPGDS